MIGPLGRRRFDRLVGEYRPLPFEAFSPADDRFHVPMHHVLKNRDRFWVALRTAARYLPPGPVRVADLGTYPGSLLRLLRRLLGSHASRLVGIGLMVSDQFRRAMAEDCGAEVLTVNLDPRNDELRGKGYPTRVPLSDGSIDFVFALEVIEHLVSPSHLVAEAFRLLAPGGHLLVTTPNVTRIGNVFKLLVGRSNFDRLSPLDYENPEDEWRPHVREYTLAEVGGLLERASFRVVEARHFLGEDTHESVKPVAQRLVDVAKFPFYVVPHFRGSLLVVGEKPRTAGPERGAGG